MTFKDFSLMFGVCMVWALNTIVSKLLVTHFGVAPMFYAASRFAIVALATFPWLFPAPRPVWRIALVGLLMGGGAFSLFFIGLKTSSPSAAAIVGQLGLPVTTVLSVLMLGEKVHLPRAVGIGLTFVGVLIVMWNPQGFAASTGLLFIAAGAVASSFAAVMMKQFEGVRPMQFQAWVGLASAIPMIVLSLIFEPNGIASGVQAGWVYVAGTLFSALVVSVLGHTIYYGLIQRYEANLIAPLTLMVPLGTIVMGVAFLQDPFGWRLALGTLVALSGVLIVAVRRSQVGGVMLWLRERFF